MDFIDATFNNIAGVLKVIWFIWVTFMPIFAIAVFSYVESISKNADKAQETADWCKHFLFRMDSKSEDDYETYTKKRR